MTPWRQLHPATRVVIVVVTGLVAANVVLQVLESSTRGADETAPRSSAFSTGSTGVAAWAELLERNGRDVVEVRGGLDDEVLTADSTLVVLDPEGLDSGEARTVRAFVHAGGRLVAGGEAATGLLDLVLGEPMHWSAAGTATAAATGGEPETRGLHEIVTAAEGSWAEPGATAPLVVGGRRVIATVADTGAGRVVAVADPSPLQNRLLDRADNAAFALAVTGDGLVRFAEGQHGYGDATGLGAIPARWRIALAGLGIAAVLGAVAAGRRLGPPEDEARALAPPRRVYVDAVADALARTGQPAEALAPLQSAARARLASRAGLAPGAGPDDLVAAATRLGWPPDEAVALVHPLRRRDEILAAGRAVARLEGEQR